MPHAPPMGFTRYFQINTMAPPEIIPARTPHLVVRFQNSAVSIAGAKVAPKPAQAKDTMPNTLLLGSRAMNTAMTLMTTSVPRATVRLPLLLSFTPKKSCTRFWDTLEEAARSWLSAVDMVAGGVTVFVWKYLVRPMGGIWNIYELLPAFLVNVAVLVAVSLLTAQPTEQIEQEFADVQAAVKQ